MTTDMTMPGTTAEPSLMKVPSQIQTVNDNIFDENPLQSSPGKR